MRRFYRTLFSRELDNVYFANVFFAFQAALLLYVNSPFLTRIVSESTLASLYIAGSVLNIVLMVYAPKIIARLGIRTCAVSLIALALIGVIGMVTGRSVTIVSFCFILYQAVVVPISYLLDLFLERAVRSEIYTGRIRSIFLTISNVILVVSPLIVSLIVSKTGSFVAVYTCAAILLIPLLFIVALDLPKTGFGDKHADIFRGLKAVWRVRHIRSVVLARLALEFFYGWMVIYMAVYLHQSIGFSWGDIGLLFSIMLVPFVLFELPLGSISDAHANEKEIVIIGFGIMAVATAFIPMITTPLFLQWAILLFATRVGASFVEIGTESYFFKHVGSRDTGTVSVFRLTRPMGFILAPIAVSSLLCVVGLGHAFFILAALVSLGFLPTLWFVEKK